ncbi:AsmA family protein [Niveibacterium sp. SC-1]|uniref:AsmA family protein n=1 Tax=Niveibacterium sp. SC-1 TaxID=3135646 RepID=UPI00311E5278
MSSGLARFSRYLGFLLGGICAAFFAVALFLLATWDGARMRAEFADALRARTQRQIGMDTLPRLRFLPGPTLVVNGLAIGEPAAVGVAAKVGRLEARLALWPLIAGQVEIDRIRLIDADIRLGRRPDGRLSLADLLESTGGEADWPARFRLQQIALERSRIQFLGASESENYAFERVSVRVGPLIGGTRGYLLGEATLTHAPNNASGGIEFSSGYRLDPDAKSFDLDDPSLRFRGDALGATALDSELAAQEGRGDFAAALSLSGLKLRAKGRVGARDMALTATLAALGRQGDAVALRDIKAQMALTGARERFELKFALPALAPRSESFPGEQLDLEFAATGDGRKIEGRVASRVAYRPESQRVMLDELEVSWLSKGGDAPRAGLRGRVAGTLAFAPWGASSEGKLEAQVSGSEMQLSFDRQPTRRPAWQFAFKADRFDPERLARGFGVQAPAELANRFADYAARGRIELDNALVGGLRLGEVSARLESGNGLLAVEELRAKAYAGRIEGRASYRPLSRQLSLEQRWSGVSLAALAADQKRRLPLTGEADAQIDLRATTGTRDAFERSLVGDIRLAVRDANWQGMDVADFLRAVRPALKDRSTASRATQAQEHQAFERLEFACRLFEAQARCTDFAADAGWLRASGAGQFGLVDGQLDWAARMAVQSRGRTPRDLLGLRGLTVPVSIKGAVGRSVWQLDWSSAPVRPKPKAAPAAPPPSEEADDRAAG